MFNYNKLRETELNHKANCRAWTHFRPLEEWKTDVDEIVELFTNSQSPVNFVAWLASRYIGEPDHVLHTHGFYNGEYEAMMRKLDILFGYFAERMKASGLEDKVNIIFTADHGHTQVRKAVQKKAVPLDSNPYEAGFPGFQPFRTRFTVLDFSCSKSCPSFDSDTFRVRNRPYPYL
ncbi:unnamed protein product [Cylicostephanus goldi]|uniref:Uncharacterized protein n=1 Tax=Cylicostephanus goldi TaxID=71465 RepID=A0A3P7NGH7_CYLGO|nr:unnamed protein product [Cylicostephanus goldi]